MHRCVALFLTFSVDCAVQSLVSPGSAESPPTNPKAGLVAYAVPSSSPYSWQNGGAFLNYTQWKHGATWAVADHYPGFCDPDTHAKYLERAASVSSPRA